MINNKIKIAAMMLLSMGAASCSDSFLDVESKTDSNLSNFYSSKEDAYRALIGCYDGWQCTVSKGPTFTFQETAMTLADECYGGLGVGDAPNAQVLDRFDMGVDNSQVNLFDALWGYYYQGIYRCNMLINNMGENEDSDIKDYIAQAKTIRAILYFDLGRMFGNVPLVLTDEEGKNNPEQAEPKAIFAQIVKDLNEAIAAYSDKWNEEATKSADGQFTNDGMLNKYAAEALLGRVYLFYSGFYGEDPEGCDKAAATAALKDVIDSQKYELVKDFKNLWPASGAEVSEDKDPVNWSPMEHTSYKRGNTESVITMKFNYTADYNGNNDGNRTIVMISGRTGGNLAYPYGQGWGGCTVNSNLAAELGIGNRACSVIDMNATYKDLMTESLMNDIRDYSGYYNNKFCCLAKYDGDGKLKSALDGLMAGDFQISQCQDYVILRYADVLMMYSELSNDPEGFNQVCARAGVSATFNEENLREQRKLEFAFEGVRYWDLLRYGLDYAADQIEKSFTEAKIKNSDNLPAFSKQNFLNKKGLLQIPNNQITISGNKLKQNPGW